VTSGVVTADVVTSVVATADVPFAGAAAVGSSIRSVVPHLGHLAVRPSAPARVRNFVPHDPQVTTNEPSVGM